MYPSLPGHILQAQTMVVAVPIVQLQLYVNPILHYIAPPAIIYLIIQRQALSRGNRFYFVYYIH